LEDEELRWTEPGDPGEGTLAGAGLGSDVEEGFEPGTKLGRYVVLARMGSGGMGVVYAAYDPQLDRRIALKLMHQRGDDEAHAERASRRMQAEAKAMAQLSHPNVITVHDVGTIDGRVFIAMEFVDGVPLTEWMRKPGRDWHQLLEVFIKAGRGLEAAHAVGLVHRDFKPDNVLVGDDGRVRVLDFGLARRIDGTREVGDRRDREAGTPAYMSPEQHLGKPLDHRADQFSFCVALYEALYGELPFAARTRLELALAVTDGRVGPAPKRASVPNWLRWALLRGLDPDPEGRWPDMGSLLSALSRDPYRKLRTVTVWSISAAVLVSLVVGAVLVGRNGGASSVEPPKQCTSAAEEIAEVWDAERLEAVRGAFAKVDEPWAEELASEVETGLDAWADEWETMHRDTCEATARGTQSDTMLDRRMQCLARHRAEFGEFVEVITGAKPETLARVGEAVRELPPLSACEPEAIERGEGGPQRTEAEQLAVTQLERDLFRAHSLELTGAFDEALGLAIDASERAKKLDDQPLFARALLIRAQIVATTGKPAEAISLLEQADLAADRSAADRLRGQILRALARIEVESGDAEAAAIRVREARAVLERVGASELAYAELDGIAAQATAAAGELEQAEAQVRAAIDRLAGAEPPPVELARLHATRGVILRELGRYPEARHELERAQELWAGHYGEQHPTIAEVRFEQARVDQRQGDCEQAVAGYEGALAVFEQVFGTNSPDVADASVAMAVCLGELQRYDEALRHYQRARSIYRAQGESAVADLARALDAEGVVRRELGQLEQALSLHRQALTILERPRVAQRGSRGHGSRHAAIAEVLVHLGRVLVELDRPAEARAHLDVALELLDRRGTVEDDERERLAEARVLAAKAWASGEEAELERARALANLARADYLALARGEAVTELDTWLASLEAQG
jgi:tetratricopeptide (TPR) repeat protein/predicted Ser/Thr protein kinase